MYKLNVEVLEKTLEALSAQHLENVIWESDYIEGDITMKEPGRLILTLPYEAGWKVTVNGAETEGELFGGCLMAFDLEAGNYHFEMKYVPKGTAAGLAVSALSILVFAGIYMVKRRRHPGL